MRSSIGEGDAFANQLRFTYQDILRKRLEHKNGTGMAGKRILVFSLAYYPTFVGGAEVAIKEITDRNKDIEFHMITLRFDSTQPAEERIGNVIVHRVGFGKKGATAAQTYRAAFYISKILFVPLAALKARALHRKIRFDGMWAMMSYMLFPLVLLRWTGVRIPYALTLQEGDPFEHMFERWYIGPFASLLRFGFRKATVVQAISTFLAKWAVHFGHKKPIEVIPNAADVAHFSHRCSDAALDTVHIGLNRKEGDVWLISTSRLVHKNAIDDVIRALKFLPAHVHFANLGLGPDYENLEALAQKEGVSDRVHLLPHVSHDVMPSYLQACDIFIRPSRSEGMGISFIEAMAAGLPVIATQEGGIADFLFDEKRNPDKPTTGWAVDKNAPEQIAAAVKDIIARPEKVKEVVATAKKMVMEKYDWNLIARDMRNKIFARIVTDIRRIGV
jgi:glycosyltransferase involved in cell wall biosynthesis